MRFLGESVTEVGFVKEFPILWNHEFICLNCLRYRRIKIEQYIIQGCVQAEWEVAILKNPIQGKKQRSQPVSGWCQVFASDQHSASTGLTQFARQIQGVICTVISCELSRLLYSQKHIHFQFTENHWRVCKSFKYN